VAVLGATAMISLGLLVAARVSSEEFAGGLLNLLTWPMMFLSGVWFSLEGAPTWIQAAARVFPLTQMLEAARKVTLDGAGLADIWPNLAALAAMCVLFLTLGSVGFKWKGS
jgi:ABC-type multidrug transport system permease subunit